MRVFTTKSFRRFHGLIKQRVARPGEGRSGGYRTIVAYRDGERAVFLFGFAKSAQANLSKAEESDLRAYGAMLLALGANGIDIMIAGRELTEVPYDEED